MADVLLFHHVQGLTPGVTAFAEAVRASGHTVHVPDLFEGRTFGSIDDGMAFVRENGGFGVVDRKLGPLSFWRPDSIRDWEASRPRRSSQ